MATRLEIAQQKLDRLEKECDEATQSAYEYYKKYRVPAASVDDFLKKYTKYNSFSQEVAPHAARLKGYQEELERYGFCYMTKFMSVTGKPVTYYP